MHRAGLHPAGRHRAAPGRRRVRPVARSRDPVPRPQSEDGAGPESTPSAGVRARPDVARRERDEGRARSRPPASRPKGMPGFDAIEQDFLPKEADLEAARRYLERASAPKRTLNLFYSTSDVPASSKSRVAVQAMWKQIGLRDRAARAGGEAVLRAARTTHGRVDRRLRVGHARRLRRRHVNFLETLTCVSGYNLNGYCDARYDRLIERARVDAGRRRSAPDLRAGGSDADRIERSAADHPDVLGDASDDAQPRRRGLATESARPARLHEGVGRGG